MIAFVCRPLDGVRLTVASCVARRKAVLSKAHGVGKHALQSAACEGCAVGAEHARKRLPATWPDGSPVERVELVAATVAPAPSKPRVTLPVVSGDLVTPSEKRAKRERREKQAEKVATKSKPARSAYHDKPRGQLYELNGQLYSMAELLCTPEARASGVTERALWGRLRRTDGRPGWSVADAVSTPPKGRLLRTKPSGRTYAFRGRDVTLQELWSTPECQSIGLDRSALWQRLNSSGWDAEIAITIPATRANSARALVRYWEQKKSVSCALEAPLLGELMSAEAP